ncbi:DUF2946 domain-containing protein [Pseudomonas sp. TMW22090]|uniref:DUF2946 domain-containing protein n=1 Tax=Pseudomonas sp. TMW22090 TaxID=2506434 RepID=UPI001F106DF6|nr:DUF2946 domain-containing protein [Pseudomonas sp. TMW22090]MCH4876472.1 DUF2946 domain-containing protein [Pseudomonas sp. TMW22090]
MSVVRSHRALIAWMLYACVLFSALACSFSHGEQSGLELNGIGGLFCSVDNHTGVGLGEKSDDSKNPGLMPTMGCPLCSAFTLNITMLFCLSWLLRSHRKTFKYRQQRESTCPRFTWPPANPRASP